MGYQFLIHKNVDSPFRILCFIRAPTIFPSLNTFLMVQEESSCRAVFQFLWTLILSGVRVHPLTGWVSVSLHRAHKCLDIVALFHSFILLNLGPPSFEDKTCLSCQLNLKLISHPQWRLHISADLDSIQSRGRNPLELHWSSKEKSYLLSQYKEGHSQIPDNIFSSLGTWDDMWRRQIFS